MKGRGMGEAGSRRPWVTQVTKDVGVPDDINGAQAGDAGVDSSRRNRQRFRGARFDAHLRLPIQRLAIARIWSFVPASSSLIARPVSLRNTSSRLGLRKVTVSTGTVNSRTSRGTNFLPSGTSI